MVLPRENVEGFLYLFSLFNSFSFFSSEFFLCVKHPKLGIDLFFNNIFLHFLSLIHKLFLPLKLGTSCHEMSFFSSQIICLHFELPVNSPLNKRFLFCFPLSIKFVKAISHFLSDLLRRFQVGHELLFIHLIFVC